jgi:hypothetical protein
MPSRPTSLLPFLVATVLVLLALNLGTLVYRWWGNPLAPASLSTEAPSASLIGPRQVEVPTFGHNLQFGRADAALTLTVFTDPACAPCRSEVQRTLGAAGLDDVRLVFKFWPADPHILTGGLLMEIARRENLVRPFLRQLESHPRAGGDDLLSLLESAGLPLAKQRAWLADNNDDLLAVLGQDITQGQTLDLGLPPQFILAGYVLNGDTLPRARLATYLRRLKRGDPLIQPNDYWLNP